MKKLLLSVLVVVFGAGALKAQTGELMIRNSEKGLYLEHKVASKENFYSIGRLYNVHPKHLAAYNAVDMTKGLSLGQSLRIPLTDTNFNQKNNQGVPVYYTVGDKEGLFKVSSNNNKVLMEDLRKWNRLSNDNISTGEKLVVGFLVSKEMKTVAAIPKKENEIKNETGKNDPVKLEDVTEVVEEPKKPELSKKEKDKIKNETGKNDPVKLEDVREVSQDPKKTEPIIQVKEEIRTQSTGLGYFKSFFDQQEKRKPVKKDQTVTSGIFKTTSGWSDAKYYLLTDGVEPGTVIKITNPGNNKIIYAKVLGEMNAIKQNQGLNIRISNAAAAALEVEETDKFIVILKF